MAHLEDGLVFLCLGVFFLPFSPLPLLLLDEVVQDAGVAVPEWGGPRQIHRSGSE